MCLMKLKISIIEPIKHVSEMNPEIKKVAPVHSTPSTCQALHT